MGQEIRGAQHLFNCGVPLMWVPCMNVASLLTFSDDEARCKLNGKSRIGTYLTDIVLDQFTNLEKAVNRGKMHRTLQLKAGKTSRKNILPDLRQSMWRGPEPSGIFPPLRF